METISPLACGTCTCRRLTIYLPRGPARAVDRAGLRAHPGYTLVPDYQCISEAIQSNDRRRRRQIEPRERLVGAPASQVMKTGLKVHWRRCG